MGGRIREVKQVGELVLNFRGNRHHLIAYAQVQRQVRAPTPIVLHVYSKESLAETPRRNRTSNPRLELLRIVGEEFRKRAERENSAGKASAQSIHLHSLNSTPKFQRVSSPREESIVI